MSDSNETSSRTSKPGLKKSLKRKFDDERTKEALEVDEKRRRRNPLYEHFISMGANSNRVQCLYCTDDLCKVRKLRCNI